MSHEGQGDGNGCAGVKVGWAKGSPGRYGDRKWRQNRGSLSARYRAAGHSQRGSRDQNRPGHCLASRLPSPGP